MKRQQFAYEKLTHILKTQIMSGFFKPGEFIMSENELCKHYGLSRTSVRRSLDLLSKEGLIVRNIGQGTMVTPNLEFRLENRNTLNIMRPFAAHYGDNGLSFIIDQFTKLHPQVEIKVLSLPTDNFWESLRVCGDMGLYPDIVLASDRQFKELDHPDIFIDLRSLMQPYEGSMYGKLTEAFRHGYELKAAPVTFSTVYLSYNPDLFSKYEVAFPEPNWTLDDFKKAAKRLTLDTNKDGIFDLYGILLSSSFLRWPIFALQNGVDFASMEKQPKLLLNTLDTLHDLLFREHVATISQPGLSRVNSDAFLRERAAMVLTTTFEMADWMNEKPGFSPKISKLPFGDKKATLMMADALMISPMCKNLELARDFIQFAIDPEVQALASRETNFLSIHKRVNENIWSSVYLEAMNIASGQLENCHFLYELFPDLGIMEEVGTQMELFWSGLESAESLCESLLQLQPSVNLTVS